MFTPEGLSSNCLTLPSMQKIISKLALFAQQDSPVLIVGGIGTGKRILAQKSHQSSSRKDAPFITQHCSHLEKKLQELHSVTLKKNDAECVRSLWSNILSRADQGTLVVHGIHEMSLSLQAQLADYIQNKEFYSQNDTDIDSADVRIVCTTNMDSKKLLKRQKLNKDLATALKHSQVVIPHLAEKKEIISPLCYSILTDITQKLKRNIRDFTPEALQFLTTYTWPGNITQLTNIIERAVILENSPCINLESLYFPELGWSSCDRINRIC